MLRLRHVDHGDLLIPLQDTAFNPGEWPKAGAFPLFPFHNRLLNDAFYLSGKMIQLRANVMHGPAHRHPWHVTAEAPSQIEMTLHYQADEDWPFDFTAKQRFELDPSGLHVKLSLTNTSTTLMPGGIGWHPYFRPSPDGHIRITAKRQWDPFGPGGLSEPVKHDHRNPGAARPRDETQHFSGWIEATAQIKGGATISLAGDSGLSCLTTLHKQHYLCLEPVSHVAGALGVLPETCSETGMRLLSPGESHIGKVRLSIT